MLTERGCKETQTEGRLSLWLQDKRIRASLPHLSGERILDFGCGNGELARYVNPSKYVGIDINQNAIEICQKRFSDHTFLYSEYFDSSCEQFDTIAALAVVEHLKDPPSHFQQFRKILKPNGKVIITTPSPSFRKAHELGARMGVFSKTSAKDHHKYVSQKELVDFAQNAGLKIIKTRRFLGGANQLFVLRK